MKEIISKEEVERIKNIKGEVRGLALKNYGRYILQEHKKEGLKKLEETSQALGCPIKYDEIRATSFYPLWWSFLTFAIIKKLFNYDEEKFQEMGRFCFKLPNLLRLWLQYLMSLDKAAESAPKMYKTMLTAGKLTVPDYSKEQKYVIIRMEDYPVYPIDTPRIYCNFLIGYYCTAIQIVTGKKVTGEEINCVYKGDRYHDFMLKW